MFLCGSVDGQRPVGPWQPRTSREAAMGTTVEHCQTMLQSPPAVASTHYQRMVQTSRWDQPEPSFCGNNDSKVGSTQKIFRVSSVLDLVQLGISRCGGKVHSVGVRAIILGN